MRCRRLLAAAAAALLPCGHAFAPATFTSAGSRVFSVRQHHQLVERALRLHQTQDSGDAGAVATAAPLPLGASETTIEPGATISDQWEMDVYSRPVVGKDGKKLWELLLCDSTGNFKHVERIPSNMVNSREVRKAVERIIEEAPLRPSTIRFFRNAMFNMINIALSEVDVTVRPCRTTYALYNWLEARERNVYPEMEGYTPTMTQGNFFDIRTPSRLPDALRGDKYAFVALPVSEFRKGGSIDDSNIGLGRLCPIDPEIPDDAMVQGLAVFTKRALPLATWLSGLEVAFMKADLKRRELVMECGISTQYLVARVTDDQRAEAQNFEAGKRSLGGLHFVAVQEDPDIDQVAGFWLLKEVTP
ncbi:hypothetical protein JKP88DRAFT_197491 [Tribonema minus]|uniref:Uncharacterized protein n=1 Tax=Tribonema minus TaxID=303371 RepID=A0A836CLG2_9STRA|nr:hypothetical protein JKP88DRAFT_197491 [Tribonema minus]